MTLKKKIVASPWAGDIFISGYVERLVVWAWLLPGTVLSISTPVTIEGVVCPVLEEWPFGALHASV